MAYTYEYPHPAVTVDVAVFTISQGRLAVVLIRRAEWPHAGKWAIPGGFVGIDESLKRAAWRELREETGLKAASLEQLGAFGRPDRDPRERVITVVYTALAAVDRLDLRAGSDASDVKLFYLDELPSSRSTTAGYSGTHWTGCGKSSMSRTWRGNCCRTASR